LIQRKLPLKEPHRQGEVVHRFPNLKLNLNLKKLNLKGLHHQEEVVLPYLNLNLSLKLSQKLQYEGCLLLQEEPVEFLPRTRNQKLLNQSEGHHLGELLDPFQKVLLKKLMIYR